MVKYFLYSSLTPKQGGKLNLQIADSVFSNLVIHFPGSDSTSLKFVEIHDLHKNYGRKLFYMNHLLKKDLDSETRALVLSKRAKLYRLWGKEEKSITDFRQALELEPQNLEIRNCLAQCLTEEKKYQEALDLLKPILKKSPQAPEIYLQAYLIYSELGEREKAVEVLQQSLELCQPPKQAFVSLIKHYEENRETQKAENLLKLFVMKYPEDMNLCQLVYSYFMEKGQHEEALKILKTAKSNNEDDPFPLIMLAHHYINGHKPGQSLKILDEALLLFPNSKDIYFYYALAYYDLKEWKKAEVNLEKSLAISGKNPVAMNMLAWLYLTSPPGSEVYKPAQALKLAKQVVSLAPGSPAYKDTLGRAYYASKHFDEAISIYKETLQNPRTRSFAYYGLGISYHRTGNKKKSLEMLKKALESGFDDELLMNHDRDIPLVKKMLKQRNKT
ncbi:MAG: tetratricopeptide repeat protein [Vulcanimicrobiota bacterium]